MATHRHKISYTFYLFIISIVFSACFRNTITWPDDTRSAVYIPNNATNFVHERQNDIDIATFNCLECYPTEAYIQKIRDYMFMQGWDPVNFNIINVWAKYNSNIRSNSKGVWENIIDNNSNIYVWSDQYADKSGNIVMYGLKYDCGFDNTSISINNNCNLNVITMFLPDYVKKNLQNVKPSR